jgi:hypothetical protein
MRLLALLINHKKFSYPMHDAMILYKSLCTKIKMHIDANHQVYRICLYLIMLSKLQNFFLSTIFWSSYLNRSSSIFMPLSLRLFAEGTVMQLMLEDGCCLFLSHTFVFCISVWGTGIYLKICWNSNVDNVYFLICTTVNLTSLMWC